MPPEISDLLSAPTISGWDLAFAAASLLIAWILSIFAKKGVLRLLRTLQGIGEGAAILTARLVRYAILLVGVGAAFAFLGASIQPLIAIGLIVAAVIVLALRGISANFAAGVVLQTRHPIKVGDEIEAADYIGTVRELNGRSVVITTRDGRTIRIPNSLILENPLVNHSEIGHRRSDVHIRCHSGIDRISEVTALVTDAAASVDAVDTGRPVEVLVQTIEPERVILLLRFWHDPLAAPAILSPVILAIADTLNAARIENVVTSIIPEAPLTVPPSV